MSSKPSVLVTDMEIFDKDEVPVKGSHARTGSWKEEQGR